MATLTALAGMGYAIPGSIIAVGILIPLAAFDNMLADWLESQFGIRTGLRHEESGAEIDDLDLAVVG